jgi:class 3 adenylate cyclase/tetratricopeptide (TPR) repeat protein/ABC-type cobalamin transport system ATPase subunit
VGRVVSNEIAGMIDLLQIASQDISTPSSSRPSIGLSTGLAIDPARRAPEVISPASRSDTPERVRFERCTLDLAGRVFSDAGGREIPLTRAEFAMLAAFVLNPGRTLSRNQLRNAVGGVDAESYERATDMLVSRVRRKIEPDANSRFIVTVPGAGYKFVARIQRVDELPNPIADISDPDRADHGVRRAERRQLTVLSCQICGVAKLSATFDPEDLQKVLEASHEACATVVTGIGGTIVRASGDNLLAYFGYPSANENDAESGVRAGLELLRVVRKLKAWDNERLRARIGIATGLVLIADMAAGSEPSAVGEAIIQAHHLQSVAAIDSVLIAASTRDLVGHFFECQQLETVTMPNRPEPMHGWRVIREVTSMERFEALRRHNMLELVGREEELKLLCSYWSNARQGSGQIIHLSGEAGIGKSRLVAELEQRASIDAHGTLKYTGSPHRADAPFSALITELERSAGVSSEDPASRKLAKLTTLFKGAAPDAEEAAAVVAELLGLPGETEPNTAKLSPQERKRLIFGSMLTRIEAMALRAPLLAVVEDAQWVDPTSFELLTALVERVATLPILLVVVSRPQFSLPWPNHSDVAVITLSRLAQADSAQLVNQIEGNAALPRRAKKLILSRSDGVPLFIEELTRAVFESRAVHKTGDGGSSDTNMARLIPKTLQASLLARLDRLGRGKVIAQIGAAIGREFPYKLLRLLMAGDEQVLDQGLDQLVATGLVIQRGSRPHATFVFKHALVRDAAYGMLLRARRQKLHARIALAFEEQFPDTIKVQPELLAYHYGEAANVAKTTAYLLQAAERALLRSAITEAVADLARAQDLVRTLRRSKVRLQIELKLEIILGRAFTARRSFTATETREAYDRARARCEAIGNQAWLPLIMLGQCVGAWSAANHQSALKLAGELHSRGDYNKDTAAQAVAHFMFGMSLMVLGDLVGARSHLEHALRINRFTLPSQPPVLFSDMEGRISSLTYLHDCLLLLGLPDQAAAIARQAEAVMEEGGPATQRQSYSRALAQNHMLRMYVFDRDVQKVAAMGAALLQLSKDQDFPYFIGTSMIYTGWAWAMAGEAEQGIELCQKGIAQLRSIGTNCWFPRYFSLLAECYEQVGDIERAGDAIAEALKNIQCTGERVWEAEIYRLKGRLLLLAGSSSHEAGDCFAKGLRIAREQKAKLLELRAAICLAGLMTRDGEIVRARKLLAPIYDEFGEGFHYVDLLEAKALLDGPKRSKPPANSRR